MSIPTGRAGLTAGGVTAGLILLGLAAAAGPDGGKPAAKNRALTYSRDIAPILYDNCTPCHRAGEVAPFALESYRDAARRAEQIKLVTSRRLMPPWKADSHGEFLNERRLTDAQIEAVSAWADAGAPEGDPKDLPPKPVFPAGWRLGEPDLVVEMPESYAVPAEGKDEYRCFVIPTQFGEDRYVSGIEVQPGNRRVVHHVIAYLDRNGKARKLDAADPGPGYENPTAGSGPGFFPAGMLAGWAPGNEPSVLPDGVGALLPKSVDIVMEVHYNKSGKPEQDKTRIGLHFAKKPVDKRVRIMPVVNPFLAIPPGAEKHEVKAGIPVRQDVTVLGVTPHMHMLGRSMRVFATLPDGSERQLVNVPDWDFSWQYTYAFKEPLKLPKGAELRLVAAYDNSSSNPRNPFNPPRLITWGESTKDEMCIAFVTYTADEEQISQGRYVRDPYEVLSAESERRGD